MARPTIPPPPPPANTKPLPSPTTTEVLPQQQRPGTSGTEAALKTSRRRASATLRQAERAERAYRAKKRAAATRANYVDAKDHLRQAREHFTLGTKLLAAVVRGWPYVLREKREARRVKGEEEKRRKVMEKRRRLDEKLAAEEEAGREQEGEEREVD